MSGAADGRPPVSALLGLGSNVGDRRANLERAVELLRAAPGIERVRATQAIETEPVGDASSGPLGGLYLNAACEVSTRLSARELLDLCHAIEAELGRERRYQNAPRTIDLDLLLYGQDVIQEPGLIVPHPRMLERGFVLEPLTRLSADRIHPVSRRPLREHWEEWRSLHDHHR